MEYSDEDMGAYARHCIRRGKNVYEISQTMGKTEDEVRRLMIVAGGCACGSGHHPQSKGCQECAPGKVSLDQLRGHLEFRQPGATTLLFVEIPDPTYDTSEIEQVLAEHKFNMFLVTEANIGFADIIMVYSQSYAMGQQLLPNMPEAPLAIVFPKSLLDPDRNILWRGNYQYGDKVTFK